MNKLTKYMTEDYNSITKSNLTEQEFSDFVIEGISYDRNSLNHRIAFYINAVVSTLGELGFDFEKADK